MGDFCCDTRQQMIKGATVEPALRPKFVLWGFFMFRDFICYNFICPMFFRLRLNIVVLSMFLGTIFVDTHSVEDTSTYICGQH